MPTQTTGTLTLATPNPAYGDTIHFDVAINDAHRKDVFFVQVSCTQDGLTVYRLNGDIDGEFVLAGESLAGTWEGGAAEGQAQLIRRFQQAKAYEFSLLDTVSFTVTA